MEFALWGLGGAVVTSLVLQVVKTVWLKDGERLPWQAPVRKAAGHD